VLPTCLESLPSYLAKVFSRNVGAIQTETIDEKGLGTAQHKLPDSVGGRLDEWFA